MNSVIGSIPPEIEDQLEFWGKFGTPTLPFVESMLRNDWETALDQAGFYEHCMVQIGKYIKRELPPDSHGGLEKIRAWQAARVQGNSPEMAELRAENERLKARLIESEQALTRRAAAANGQRDAIEAAR